MARETNSAMLRAFGSILFFFGILNNDESFKPSGMRSLSYIRLHNFVMTFIPTSSKALSISLDISSVQLALSFLKFSITCSTSDLSIT